MLQRDQLKVREYLIPPSLAAAEQQRFQNALANAKQKLSEVLQRTPAATPVGGMIEVPVAAIIADVFAKYIDFFHRHQ